MALGAWMGRNWLLLGSALGLNMAAIVGGFGLLKEWKQELKDELKALQKELKDEIKGGSTRLDNLMMGNSSSGGHGGAAAS